jgi:hypothetical protein
MDADTHGRIYNIKMYERNILRDHVLDLNIRSDVVPEVISKEFPRL